MNKVKYLIFIIIMNMLLISCNEEEIKIIKTSIDFRDLSSLQEDNSFQKGPYLMNVSKTSITIMWETEEPTNALIDYGLTTDYNLSISDSELKTLHEITLTGLEPETLYYYRVTSNGISTIDLSFMTAVNDDTPFRFTVFGDSQTYYKISEQIFDLMQTVNPFIVMSTGDVVGDGDNPVCWQDEYFNPTRRLAHYVPFFRALGNHEHNSTYFYQYISYPEPENYYAFTYGNAYFLVLDATQSGFTTIMGEAKIFLDEQFASDAFKNATWRFAFYHEPAYTESWGGCDYDGEGWERTTLIPLLEEKGFNMVFNGHTHAYERGYLNNIYYIISGGGGGTLDVHCKDYEFITLNVYEYHFVQVDIIQDKLTLNAIDINSNVLDTIEIDLNIN